MHEAALSVAAIPETVRILRLPMRPFSLGHELALIRRNNPLVCLTPDDFDGLTLGEKRRAVISAAHVCHQGWNENLKSPRWMRLWGWLIRKADFSKAASDFRSYRVFGCQAFPADLPSGLDCPLRFIGAPEPIRLYQFIIGHLPATEYYQYGSSAWDFPYGLARMHYQTYQEQEGNLEIYNSRLKAHDDYVAEQEAIRIAEEKAKEESCPVSVL